MTNLIWSLLVAIACGATTHAQIGPPHWRHTTGDSRVSPDLIREAIMLGTEGKGLGTLSCLLVHNPHKALTRTK